MSQILLKGKVACITGASRGIGAGIARALAKEGCRLGICSRREADIEQMKKELEDEGCSVVACSVDVTSMDQMKQFRDAVLKKFGTIDIWVNNAGYMPITLMENVQHEEWDRVVDINCKGVLHGIACCLPVMKEHNSGHIINISSDGGKRQFDYITVYCATKYFVEGLALGLRREIKNYNIRVTNIQPGDVGTDIGMESTDKQAIRQ
ncbi:oxidoreductase [Blastocystis sp. subtype 4]|uniref:oxidoreductase n=1 Tax=Blastocystis sp. subtype 4 TaxID=944170 RepID=UPI000711670F|nr:oxidoreductase [Blastocystis sp. subtype 4]KNB42492.1 oxidoreductase [Blastocystis sp. subtype 4]|eukprot:XP_014525935.1 oxidoreductase [Blastocystis sp. subtype 4]